MLKLQIANPASKTAYEAAVSGGQTAYNVAVTVFFHAPDIKSVDLSKYAGNEGDTIEVRVTDDFKVTGVAVSIYNADGSEVEHGQAVQSANVIDWTYTATVGNESLDGDRIVIRAYDLPGNTTQAEKKL